MKITLVRHGRPQHNLEELGSRRFIPAELGQLVSLYIGSGIDRSLLPSDALIHHARQCRRIVCSDLKRSIESSELLGQADRHECHDVFREVDIPYFYWKFPRLKLISWVYIMRILWFAGFSRNGEPIRQTRQRLAAATQLLINEAQAHDSVMLVGHGFVNHFISKNLLAAGWQGAQKPGQQYWDYTVYEYAND